ncbi:hypothetical protein [Altererythrobacter sp. Z27]|uniref:hypothetical protein n=1 Tax=Altererythrobacter sp. Z27 TaxID=3461147 RepID=UPI004043C961
MSALASQRLIAAVFLLLGGWALFAPQSVIDLAITPEYRDSTFLTSFTMGCFGAQACLFGLMTLFVRYTSRAFLVFALALLPFFAFDWYFHVKVPVLNSLGMLDLVGNIVMFGLAIHGWRAMRAEELRV